VSATTHPKRLLTVILCLTISGACGRESQTSLPASTAPPEAAVAADTGSVYDLDVRMTDAAGRARPLTDLRGQLIVAAMMYTSCTSICPRVTADMKAVEEQLAARGVDDVTFALFSLDPGRDDPAALKGFAELHRLSSRWRLFTASEEDVRTLAMTMGVKYAPEDNGEIAHSATIVVIDPAGVVRHRQVGLSAEPQLLLEAVQRARS
jgi:protein SCO1/2